MSCLQVDIFFDFLQIERVPFNLLFFAIVERFTEIIW